MIISIEGNIGSGKSTLLKNLQTHFGTDKKIIFLEEPVAEWETITNANGTTMLQLFYEDQKKHAFAFQMMAYISRLALLKEAVDNNQSVIIITERSLYTDCMVFAKMLFDSGHIEVQNYKIYLKWFNTFIKDYTINKVIYVKATPEVCYKRIATRSRDGESNIPLEYLSNCDKYHTKMLNVMQDNCFCSNQLVLDGNVDIYQNNNQLQIWISQITRFIEC
jgi:deoxyadenosine/deoxycytidine kinase